MCMSVLAISNPGLFQPDLSCSAPPTNFSTLSLYNSVNFLVAIAQRSSAGIISKFNVFRYLLWTILNRLNIFTVLNMLVLEIQFLSELLNSCQLFVLFSANIHQYAIDSKLIEITNQQRLSTY